MKHYLYCILTEDEDEQDIIVGAETRQEADRILLREVDITHFLFLDELTEEEAENSGLDEL